MNDFLGAFKKYAVFSGRSGRKEYWLFFLFNLIINVVSVVIQLYLSKPSPIVALVTGLVFMAYSLAALIPGLALTVRRLHDTNHSAWWLLINLIPLVGGIIFLVFMIKDGEPTQNQYGQPPKSFEMYQVASGKLPFVLGMVAAFLVIGISMLILFRHQLADFFKESITNNLDNAAERAFGFKIDETDPVVCEKLTKADAKDMCYYMVSVNTNDISVCEKIAGSWQKDNCLRTFGAN